MKQRIVQDMQAALKKKNTAELSALRMMLAELQNKEKEKGIPVDEAAAVQLFQSMIRKRKEAADQFASGGREDLAQKERGEMDIIMRYLPRQLSADELRDLARDVMAECSAAGPKDTGKVMGLMMKKVAGRADGSTVKRIVQEELGSA